MSLCFYWGFVAPGLRRHKELKMAVTLNVNCIVLMCTPCTFSLVVMSAVPSE